MFKAVKTAIFLMVRGCFCRALDGGKVRKFSDPMGLVSSVISGEKSTEKQGFRAKKVSSVFGQ